MATLKKTLRCELVRGKGNVLDEKATLKAFQDALNDLRVSESLTDDEIQMVNQALDQFLADHSEKVFKLPDIKTVLVGKYLDVPMSQYQSVQNKIGAVVRMSTDRFWIRKGQNGGVCVIDRLSSDEIKTMNEAREKEAAEAAKEAAAEVSNAAE